MKAKDYLYIHDEHFQSEAGGQLPAFQLKYTTLGNLNAEKSNAVWVCHALTGDSQFTDWWSDLFVGAGAFDPNEYFIICANVLGGCAGSTGPLSVNPVTNQPYYHTFPMITNKDVVRAFDLLRIHLNLPQIDTLVGGSLGGQQALEWAIYQPTVFRKVIPIACNAFHSSWGRAINESQRMALESDPTWGLQNESAGLNGLRVARAISMSSFRTYDAYALQNDNDERLQGYSAASYQQYHGNKLAERFNAYSYYMLTRMMDSHDLGRGKSSAGEALKIIEAKVLIIGIDSDLLFPLSEQEYLYESIDHAELRVLSSQFGHDAFLKEANKLGVIIKDFVGQKSKTQINV
ncbi:MAG: homoserine O-acetyltransferase [Cyclobacteriaceae bacterium]